MAAVRVGGSLGGAKATASTGRVAVAHLEVGALAVAAMGVAELAAQLVVTPVTADWAAAAEVMAWTAAKAARDSAN